MNFSLRPAVVSLSPRRANITFALRPTVQQHMIANQLVVRHRNEAQKADYDPAFLDWLFWWYLATIELTDRILARQTALSEAAELEARS